MKDDSSLPGAAKRGMHHRLRQMALTIGTIVAVVGTAMGFLSDSLGLWQYARDLLGRPAVETPVGPVEPTANGFIALASPTPVALPPTATPSPTPLPVMAAPGETLLVVAQFANYAGEAGYNVAGRIQEALAAQVKAAKLADTRVAVWPEVLAEPTAATPVISATQAAMVIWGEYDSGRVRVSFALPDGREMLGWQRLLNTPAELATIINLDAPREVQALALIAVGKLYRDAGRLDEAKAAFAQALAQQPSEADTVATLAFYLGYLYAAGQPPQLDQAIDLYGQTIELRPEWVNARYNRGVAFLDRYGQDGDAADLERAIEDLSAVLAARPRTVDATLNRGIAYYTRNGEGDLARALADFDAAIAADDRSPRAFYNRGLARIRADDRAGWEADLSKTLDLAPTDAAATYAFCWGYALDALPDAGLPYCEQAAGADPSGATHDARGLVYAELGRLQEAASDLERYLAWLRGQPPAWYRIYNGPLYAELLARLAAGENPVDGEVLARLR
jgi:tetratricopeptide (TPR) repeat protein